jgi:3-hydroxy-9,10-secoandrosta-1,3,5(10)-triene-9,17-dione monooxygenase reductase component
MGGAPLIPDCAACFQCETRHRYEGGDHVIIVGEVLEYQRSERSPLIFHDGQFASTRYVEAADDADKSSVDLGRGSFTPDFLGYLLARAHFQLYRPLIAEAREADLSEVDYFVLSVLCIRNRLSDGQLNAFLSHTGCAPSLVALADLERRGLITTDQDREARFSITESGRDTYLGILMLDKLMEERGLADFQRHEVVELTAYLRRIIANTDPGVPDLWSDVFTDAAVID